MAPRLLPGSFPRAPCLARASRPDVSCPWALTELRGTRSITQSYLRKVTEGEERWAKRAEKIQNGEIPHLLDVLDERGYIKDLIGDRERVKELMRVKRIGVYMGVDPTADSLHLGHLLSFMPLFWMWFHGYPATTLLGGSTARIGDPIGRAKSREIISNSDISKNLTKMHFQLSRLWANVVQLRGRYGYESDWAAKRNLLNNSMWLQGLSTYDFTKRLLRHLRIGPMLSRESVKRWLENGEGMTLGEFIYPLYQGWDFYHLYSKLGIQMQIGGSDQFGNIVTGIEIFKTLRETEELPASVQVETGWQHDPVGFTVPLLTDSAGAKLGKSDGNAIWLDEFKLSPFDLYGYFMRRSDEDVEKLLKLFTFIPIPKIQEIMAKHLEDPGKRYAHHRLAFEVLSLAYGSQRALEEAQQHQFRFGGELPSIMRNPPAESGIVTPNNAPRSDIQLPRMIMSMAPARVLHAAGLAESSSEGHRIVSKEGAYVAAQPGQKRGLVPGSLNWTPIKMWYPEETSKFLIDDRLLILRKGKHNVRIIELVSDEEWLKSGKIFPGQPYTGVIRRLRERLMEEHAKAGKALTPEQLNQEVRKHQVLTVPNNPQIELPGRAERRERRITHKAAIKAGKGLEPYQREEFDRKFKALQGRMMMRRRVPP